MARATPSLTSGALTPRERMQIELDRLLALYTDEHPQVRSLRRQIAAIEATNVVDPETGSSTSTVPDFRTRIENEIATQRIRLEEIDVEMLRLEALVARTSEITEEFRALQREEKILQESYTNYLRKLKNAELSRSMETAQQGAQLARLEAARPPTRPIVPRVAYSIGAVLAALAGGLLVAVAREILNPVIIDADHLANVTGLPSLGSIPLIRESA
jgi:uncharacterized protein involved in exopolysaccharide biosynthesis